MRISPICLGAKKSFTGAKTINDKQALNLLKQELSSAGMAKADADGWVAQVVQFCSDLKIKPKDLPINKENPGNLSQPQRDEFLNAVMNFVIK